VRRKQGADECGRQGRTCVRERRGTEAKERGTEAKECTKMSWAMAWACSGVTHLERVSHAMLAADGRRERAG
jgi:hypothetical protein